MCNRRIPAAVLIRHPELIRNLQTKQNPNTNINFFKPEGEDVLDELQPSNETALVEEKDAAVSSKEQDNLIESSKQTDHNRNIFGFNEGFVIIPIILIILALTSFNKY